MAVKYEIDCVQTDKWDHVEGYWFKAWRYRVVLIMGRNRYKGETLYVNHNDAKKAAMRAIEALIP